MKILFTIEDIAKRVNLLPMRALQELQVFGIRPIGLLHGKDVYDESRIELFEACHYLALRVPCVFCIPEKTIVNAIMRQEGPKLDWIEKAKRRMGVMESTRHNEVYLSLPIRYYSLGMWHKDPYEVAPWCKPDEDATEQDPGLIAEEA